MTRQIRWSLFNRAAGIAAVAGALLILSIAGTASAWPPGGSGGGHSGGGDGGGQTAPYTIVRFSPPGLTSTSSFIDDLNDQGQVVGGVNLPDGTWQPVHFDLQTGDYTLLELETGAFGINNLNQIVGEDGLIAAFWAGPQAPPVALAPLTGDALSRALAINDTGIVVGLSEDGANATWDPIAVVWRVVVDDQGVVHVNGPKALPHLPGDIHSTAVDINEVVDGMAQATGWSIDDVGRPEAAVWSIDLNGDGTLAEPGPPEGLGTVGLSSSTASEAAAINSSGDVVGESYPWPFLAPDGSGAMLLPLTRNTSGGSAKDINDSGRIVGILKLDEQGLFGQEHATLWSAGTIVDLAKQIDRNSGWERLRWATHINNSGIIAGWGTYDVPYRAFLMFPNGQ